MHRAVALRLSIRIFFRLVARPAATWCTEGSRHLFYELTKSKYTWEVLNQRNILWIPTWSIKCAYLFLISPINWSHVRVYLCLWQKSRPGAADSRHGVPVRVKPWQRTLVVLDLEGVDDLLMVKSLKLTLFFVIQLPKTNFTLKFFLTFSYQIFCLVQFNTRNLEKNFIRTLKMIFQILKWMEGVSLVGTFL